MGIAEDRRFHTSSFGNLTSILLCEKLAIFEQGTAMKRQPRRNIGDQQQTSISEITPLTGHNADIAEPTRLTLAV